MNPIIEKVARAIEPDVWASSGPTPTRAATVYFHQKRQESADIARAAIRATLEHLRDNVSEGMEREGSRFIKDVPWPDDAENAFKAMCSQALAELDA